MAKSYTTLPVRGLGTAGTITDMHPTSPLFPGTGWTASNNMRFRDGAVERAPHFRTLGTLLRGTPSFVFGYPVQRGGSELLVGMQDGTVERWSASGRHGEAGIETNLTPADFVPTKLVDPPMTAVTVQDSVFLNRADRPLWAMQKTGDGFKVAPGWNPEWTCKSIRTINGQLVAINVRRDGKTFPTMVKFSDFARFDEPELIWDADTENSAGENVLGNLAEGLVDGAELNDRMYLYASHEVYVMTPRPDSLVFDFSRRFPDQGVISQNCIVNVNNIHYVFGPDRIWAHDGQSKLFDTDGGITEDIYTHMVREAKHRFFVHYDPRKQTIHFNHVSTHPDCKFKVGRGNTSSNLEAYPGCNRAAVYDIRARTWGFADIPYSVGAAHVRAVTGTRWNELMSMSWAQLKAAGTTWAELMDQNPETTVYISPVRSIIAPPPGSEAVARDDTFTLQRGELPPPPTAE